MWDLPRPRIEPTSPALAGEFLTTRPPGKPPNLFSVQPGNGVILGIGLSLGLAGTWIHIQLASSGKPSVPCQPLTRGCQSRCPRPSALGLCRGAASGRPPCGQLRGGAGGFTGHCVFICIHNTVGRAPRVTWLSGPKLEAWYHLRPKRRPCLPRQHQAVM